jgi:hypothetical protein
MDQCTGAPPGHLKILLTEGTSLSARQTLYALGAAHTIDVLDPSALCQGRFSGFVRRWYRSPSFSRQPQEFLRYVVGRLREGGYDVLLPTHEQVFLFSRFRDSLTRIVGVALPDFDALRNVFDKASFIRLLRELALPHPATEIIATAAELDRQWEFPCYVKVAHSTAGCGVSLVRGRQELQAVIHRLHRSGVLDGRREVLVQQPATGVQSTVQAVFQHGRLVAAHCLQARRLGVGGMSTARTSAHHPIVLDYLAQLGGHLNWHGATFLDYFYNPRTGQPQFIEANPRIGETVNALLSGVNLCEHLVKVSCGETLPTINRHSPPGVEVRTHSGFMVLLSAALEGSRRRNLLQEIWRQARHRGLYEASEDELTRPRQDQLSLLPYLWIALRLLVSPRQAQRIVAQTIANYSLPEDAVQAILGLPEDTVERLSEA